MDVLLSIYLSLKTTHGWFFFYLLKPAENTWMLFSSGLSKLKKTIHVLSINISKWKENKHPCVVFRFKKMERKNIHVFSAGLSK
jgi:hypothetical protein